MTTGVRDHYIVPIRGVVVFGRDNDSRGLLGDQEPCTADRGCRIVSVEIVVLFVKPFINVSGWCPTESQYYSLKLNTELGGNNQEL